MQVVCARQHDRLDFLERRDHLLIEIGAAERALLGKHHERRRFDSLDEGAHLLTREPYFWDSLQALIRVPPEAAVDLAQRAPGENLGRLGAELREAARALRDRRRAIGKH